MSIFPNAGTANDGKIVAVGHTMGTSDRNFAIVRYNPDGSLDSTFGSGGIVTTDFGIPDINNRVDYAQAVAIQPDGKLVVVGYSNTLDQVFSVALARYNSDGTLDTTFGNAGLVLTALN